ncbi:ArsA family ATPase [Streptomyces johnsoniae]|uniref:ArsA-related P-loop ATPase n=1 Tax=Streptomyces johnsoniae TaxID=3075532 RepID=A0ABU2S8B0_9ACTN|nr:ArsA-related P-loop ATPase [Streptomyces sp. DSM 41886]MDT0444074.1 ArsA-related P-loop ATPase [Streptomyces sp. DSM 41886]
MSGPRTLFVTGPGGDGATTVAAATALAAARAGTDTLLLSPAPEDRLAALLGAAPPPGGAPDGPARVAPGLTAARIDRAAAFRTGVLAAQRRVRPALDLVGAAVLDDDELTELPGSGEAAVLGALHAAHAAADPPRLIVLDLPGAVDAVRLLALPGQLRRYLRRLLPQERRTARALHPLLAQLAGVPLPAAALLGAAEGWDAGLAALEALIAGPDTAARLVLDPTERSAAELRAARAGLALHGIAVESVVANRLVPVAPADAWAARLAARQESVLTAFVRAARLPEPHRLPHLGAEPGPAGLAALPLPPPGPPLRAEPRLTDRRDADGLLVWRLPLPGADRAGLGLVRRGDELIVTAGPFRRALPLPAVLRRCTVAGAALADDGALAVRFAPDPGRWPDAGSEGSGGPG